MTFNALSPTLTPGSLQLISNKRILHIWHWFTKIKMANTCKALFKTFPRLYSMYSHSYSPLAASQSPCQVLIYIILHKNSRPTGLRNLPKGLTASEWKGWMQAWAHLVGKCCWKRVSLSHYIDKESHQEKLCDLLQITHFFRERF